MTVDCEKIAEFLQRGSDIDENNYKNASESLAMVTVVKVQLSTAKDISASDDK